MDNTMNVARPVFHGWWVVAACFVIAAFAWSLGLFGSSVILQAVTAAHGWAVAQVASAITLFYLTGASVQRLVGRGIDRWGPRPVIIPGALILGVGIAMVGRIDAAWQLYPCYMLIGLGWSALSTTGISATVAPWFERQQGRSITLAIMGASVGAIVGAPLLILAIRNFGLAGGLLAAGVLTVVTLVPLAAIVLRYRGPQDIGLGRDGVPLGVAAVRAEQIQETAPTAGRAALWSAAICFALGLTTQIGFLTHHVTLAHPLLGTTGAGWLVSATGLSAFIGRLILARIVDGVDVRRLGCIILVMQIAALLSIAAWPTVPVLIVASLAYGYGVGHITTLGPVVVRREFGAAAFGAMYGTAATVIQFTSAFGPAVFGALRDALGGYRPVLVFGAVMTCAALIVLRWGRPTPPAPPAAPAGATPRS